MALETANLAGLSQTGAPVMVRGSMARPISAAARAAIISRAAAVRGALPFESILSTSASNLDVITVNINLPVIVDNVNIHAYDHRRWSVPRHVAPEKSAPGSTTTGTS